MYVFAATNGWIMGPAIKFAEKQYRVYNRRALVSWGDCVKLKYDEKLKALAGDYVEKMASMF